MDSFDVPKSGDPLTALGPVVQALAKACNGLTSLRFESGEDWAWSWEEGGAVITYPSSLDDASSGGGLGPYVFAGTASGAVAYFLVNSDGTAYTTPPAGYSIANPGLAVALFNTLDRFPFQRPHAPAGTLAVSLEMATRWYWRVRRWRGTITLSGSVSVDGETLTAVDAFWYQDFLMAFTNGGADGGDLRPIASEAELLFPNSFFDRVGMALGEGGSATYSGGGPAYIEGDVEFHLFNFSTPGAQMTYDVGAGNFTPGHDLSAYLNVGAGNLPFIGLSTDSADNTTPFDLPVNIDGKTFTIPGFYGGSYGAAVTPAPVTGFSARIDIVPTEFWGWGGKYDTATGARL